MIKPDKIATILLFVITPFFISAQSTGQRNDSKFSIGVSFSPDYVFRNLSEQVDNVWVDIRNDVEEPRFGFTTGLVAKYSFTRRLALESGIRFSDKGYKIAVNSDDWITPDGLTDSGFQIDDPAIPNKVKMKYSYSYLGIPVKLNYYFLERRIRSFVSAGVSTDFFLSGKVKSVQKYSDRTDKDISDIDQDFNNVNFTGIVGVGLEANVSEHLELRFEPVLRYAMKSIWKDASFCELPYSIGANVVLFWGF